MRASGAKYYTPRVYWGFATRDKIREAFGKAYPEGARVYFAWLKQGWHEISGKAGTYTETMLALWYVDGIVWSGIAARKLKRNSAGHVTFTSSWKHQLANSRRSTDGGINLDKEMQRAAGLIYMHESGKLPKDQTEMMPLEVARGYAFALSRMIDRREAERLGLEEPVVEVDETDATGEFGVVTPPVAVN